MNKNTDKRLREEKIKTLGQLSASVIHQLRNYLGIISSVTQFTKEKLDVKGPFAEQIDIIWRNVRQANSLINEFMYFAKTGNIKPLKQSITPSLESTVRFIKPIADRRKTKISLSVNPKLKDVLIDQNYIQGAFLNIAMNAIEAMKNGGSLKITAESKKGALEISFSDTGPGISEDKIKNIFEAFYTTKEDGAGLGLNIAKTIIEHHKGRIKAESTPGKSTKITVSLSEAK